MTRWFMNYGGEGKLIETEGRKYSVPLIRSVMGDEFFKNRYMIAPVDNLGDAHKHFTLVMKDFENAAGKKETLELAKSSLACLTVDSMAGQDTQAVIDKIRKEGSAGTTVATIAKAWFVYLRYMSSALIGYPCSMILINHLLDEVGSMIPGKKYTPGGKGQRFFSSLYFWVTRLGASERETYISNGETLSRPTKIRSLGLKTEKSSVGEEGRSIKIDFCWYFDPETNNQVSYFDWKATTCKLLLEQQGLKDTRLAGRKLRDIVDVTEESGKGGKVYTSRSLGLKEVPDHELGAAVDNNPELLKELHAVFHINQHQVWNGRMPSFTDTKKPVKAPVPEEIEAVVLPAELVDTVEPAETVPPADLDDGL